MNEIKVNKQVDTSGKCCPMPIVDTNVAMKKLNSGEIMQIIATDPGTLTDIPSWCERSGHRLLESSNSDGVIQFYVQKA